MSDRSNWTGKLDLYPSIDLRGGGVVRLAQGDFARETQYDVDPIDAAKSYADAGAAWLHVVDLDGAKAGAVQQTEAIRRIIEAEPRLKVQAGGGVRSRDDVDRLLEAGASRVVIGTRAVRDWDWFIDQLRDEAMHDRLTLAVDAKDGQVATQGWQAGSDVTAIELAQRTRGLPVAAILYTDVARDGLLGGVDAGRTAALAEATDVPVLASGGVGSIDDLPPLIASNVSGVIVGRALYEKKLDLAEAVRRGRGD